MEDYWELACYYLSMANLQPLAFILFMKLLRTGRLDDVKDCHFGTDKPCCLIKK